MPRLEVLPVISCRQPMRISPPELSSVAEVAEDAVEELSCAVELPELLHAAMLSAMPAASTKDTMRFM